MDRDLAINLVRVTEAAALSSARHLGRGNKNKADEAAVDAMRRMFDTLNINGRVVIGEGEMDEAPMLYIGEKLGRGGEESLKLDIAVDPLDGTTAVAKGIAGAISVVVVAPKGALLNAPDMYMDKIAVGPRAVDHVSLDYSVGKNLYNLSRALNKDIKDITVTILDRPRHQELIEEVREIGARIRLFSDGDIAAALATCFPATGVDILMGIGGAPEGVLAAAAQKCLGGGFQGRLYPMNEKEKTRCKKMGIKDIDKTLYIEDLARGKELVFAATGVSNGELLKGVVYYEYNRAKTYSIVMRGETGTVRHIEAIHRLDKKPRYAK